MKKKLFLISVFLLSLLSQNAQNGVTIYDSILSGGLQRKFRLYVPNSYSAANPVPLILNLHGYTSNSLQQLQYSNFLPIADTAKFLVVHPDGTAPNGPQYWNAGFGGSVNDVQFLSNLIDSIKASYNIDLNRVYSCGMSNGGIMSYYLALYLPNRITAIASVTGSMLNAWYNSVPNLPRAFPVMEIHGTADATVPYNGDATFAHIDSVVRKWRKYNNCIPTAVTYSVPNINTTDNCTAVNYLYTGGTDGATVELYKVNGGTHSWPGSPFFISGTNQDFKASVEIWRFFRKYSLNQFVTTIGVNENKINPESVKLFPNPAKDVLHILAGNQIFKAEIRDLTGKLIKEEHSYGPVNISELNQGIYFITVKTNSSVTNLHFIKSTN